MPCPNDPPPDDLEVVEAGPMTLLPPPPGTCPLCAVAHEPGNAHNQQSLFYQMRFQMAHGRGPRWSDAVMHCAPDVRAHWIAGLRQRGAWTKQDDDAVAGGTAIAEPVPTTPNPE